VWRSGAQAGSADADHADSVVNSLDPEAKMLAEIDHWFVFRQHQAEILDDFDCLEFE
jgi:hypothetical protein